MSKLAIAIPLYKGKEHLKRNFKMWYKLVRNYECYFIEDDMSEDSKYIVEKIGGTYLNKLNGRWGSVVNLFKKVLKDSSAEYATIFDQDDVIDLDELEQTVSQFRTNDIYITNYKKIGSINEEYNYKINDSYMPFIHALYFKRELFISTPDLLENNGYSDEELRANLFLNAQSVIKIETCPYMHVYGIFEQSTSGDIENTEWYYNSILRTVQNIFESVVLSDSKVVKSTILNKLEYLILKNKNNKQLLKMYSRLYKAADVNKFRAAVFLKALAIFKKQKFNI